MSLECAECEHDLRGGHGVGCSRYVRQVCGHCGGIDTGDEENICWRCWRYIPSALAAPDPGPDQADGGTA